MKYYFVTISVAFLVIGVRSHQHHNHVSRRSRMPKDCVRQSFDDSVVSQSRLVLLAEKVNQRLAYMKDVAGYKAQNHLQIEDVVQESKVINSSLTEAKDLGLDPESVISFIVAQINAAKAIQYRYRADWLSYTEEDWQPQPLDMVREKIGQLSSEILRELAAQANDRPVEAHERNAFVLRLEQDNLKCADKMRLFDAILVVRSSVSIKR
ncbi:secreted chorismate mutase-like [Bradysia coprophila]|uniref:secreted chorismate mutase-like n=1 Tax=Bradysia coprophila TaxID=38358 RepID=UPI00187D97DF|nr:secreted chorismate mutase-like [Bradysia coprophila]